MAAKRYNKDKVQMSLLPLDCLEQVARVLEHGAAKYDRDNWKKGQPKEQIIDSLLRHLTRIQQGEERDQESGELHSAHVACNALFLIWESIRLSSLQPSPLTEQEKKDADEEYYDGRAQQVMDGLQLERGVDFDQLGMGDVVVFRGGSIGKVTDVSALHFISFINEKQELYLVYRDPQYRSSDDDVVSVTKFRLNRLGSREWQQKPLCDCCRATKADMYDQKITKYLCQPCYEDLNRDETESFDMGFGYKMIFGQEDVYMLDSDGKLNKIPTK